MVLGKNIRYLRKQKDMSQDKLAELLGYKSFTTIQKWESGVAEPPFKTLVKIADLFRVDVDTLVSDDLSIDHSVEPDFILELEDDVRLLLEYRSSLSPKSWKRLKLYAEFLKKEDRLEEESKND